MRALILAVMLLPAPALAWEASIGRICTLTHEEDGARVRLTYDPAGPIYAITVTRPGAWSAAPVFAIRFDGPRALTISTNRHRIDGAALTVTDRGFGNVLNGLEYNTTATALLGDQSVRVSLQGAAPAVRAFRACSVAPAA